MQEGAGGYSSYIKFIEAFWGRTPLLNFKSPLSPLVKNLVLDYWLEISKMNGH